MADGIVTTADSVDGSANPTGLVKNDEQPVTTVTDHPAETKVVKAAPAPEPVSQTRAETKQTTARKAAQKKG